MTNRKDIHSPNKLLADTCWMGKNNGKWVETNIMRLSTTFQISFANINYNFFDWVASSVFICSSLLDTCSYVYDPSQNKAFFNLFNTQDLALSIYGLWAVDINKPFVVVKIKQCKMQCISAALSWKCKPEGKWNKLRSFFGFLWHPL